MRVHFTDYASNLSVSHSLAHTHTHTHTHKHPGGLVRVHFTGYASKWDEWEHDVPSRIVRWGRAGAGGDTGARDTPWSEADGGGGRKGENGRQPSIAPTGDPRAVDNRWSNPPVAPEPHPAATAATAKAAAAEQLSRPSVLNRLATHRAVTRAAAAAAGPTGSTSATLWTGGTSVLPTAGSTAGTTASRRAGGASAHVRPNAARALVAVAAAAAGSGPRLVVPAWGPVGSGEPARSGPARQLVRSGGLRAPHPSAPSSRLPHSHSLKAGASSEDALSFKDGASSTRHLGQNPADASQAHRGHQSGPGRTGPRLDRSGTKPGGLEQQLVGPGRTRLENSHDRATMRLFVP